MFIEDYEIDSALETARFTFEKNDGDCFIVEVMYTIEYDEYPDSYNYGNDTINFRADSYAEWQVHVSYFEDEDGNITAGDTDDALKQVDHTLNELLNEQVEKELEL